MENDQISRKDGWILVDERMPEEGKDVLVFVKTYTKPMQMDIATLKATKHGKHWLSISGWRSEIDEIDFWMELPQKPNENA